MREQFEQFGFVVGHVGERHVSFLLCALTAPAGTGRVEGEGLCVTGSSSESVAEPPSAHAAAQAARAVIVINLRAGFLAASAE